ncbi:ATP-binding protein [Limibacillus sp. MBR-115]|jgi:signal transduction histidine kinase|uniref:sensor histidine kinase n=1 Tax=Limibacillus sp. MBR-115 TaxID=3156465 RepID=UPI003393D8A6
MSVTEPVEGKEQRNIITEYIMLFLCVLLLSSIPLSLFLFFKKNVEIQDSVNETLWQVYNIEIEVYKTSAVVHEAMEADPAKFAEMQDQLGLRFQILVSRVSLAGQGRYGAALGQLDPDDQGQVRRLQSLVKELYQDYERTGTTRPFVEKLEMAVPEMQQLARSISTTLYTETNWIRRIHGSETQIIKIIIYVSSGVAGLLTLAVFLTLRKESSLIARMLRLEKRGRQEAQRRAEADAKAHQMLLLLLEAERDSRREALRRSVADRKAQQMLAEMEKARSLSILTGGVAHEFNNLLMVIHGNAELMGMSGDEEARRNRLVTRILSAAKQGANLSRQLLAYARQQELDIDDFAIADLIKRSIEFSRPAIKGKAQIIVEDSDPDLLVAVDGEQFKGVMLNLLLNAAEAMPQGGEIRIGAQATTQKRQEGRETNLIPGEYVLVEVSDQGTGMTEEVIKRAFDPFYTTKEAGRGTGLGLSMVIGFVRQSGGDCWIESEEGRGTKIFLLLPTPQVAEEYHRHQLAAEREKISQGSEDQQSDTGDNALFG